ncbi:MAG: four helix bundle protein [Patescibacteria group bacterium]
MSNKIPSPNTKTYDLIERTARFGENVITFVQGLERNALNSPLISQLIRAATSIGANYMEADAAESKKDFEHKIGIARKEAKESMHWFRMVAKANPVTQPQCRVLWKEAQEFVFIFSSILSGSRSKS